MDVRTPSPQPRSQLVARGSLRSLLTLVAFGVAGLVGCAPPGKPPLPEVVATPTATPEATPTPAPAPSPTPSATPEILPDFALRPVEFADLPDWASADPGPAMAAMLRSCGKVFARPDATLYSKHGRYFSGHRADWADACDAVRQGQGFIATAQKQLLETHFTPYRVITAIEGTKLTGYFEPMMDVRAAPAPGYSAAIARPPSDLISVDLRRFEDASSQSRIVGKMQGGQLVPYDDRSEIVKGRQDAIAWGEKVDVFYLQIQGSGRLRFPDGRQLRAAYAANNGRPYQSIARHLIASGEIQSNEAGMEGIRRWMNGAGPEAAQELMNVNPRYIWFRAETIADPNEGPKGAEGVPLTPLGSMAVDPAFHAYGVPIYVDSLIPRRPGDWQGETYRSLVIAQDTGGAIKGPVRGDLFFGWGDEAGGRASSMNHEAAMWVLLPKGVDPEQGGGE